MCRLFAQVSPRPADARRWLADSEFSLLKQGDFNAKQLQKDGWGIAWFGNDGRPRVSKSPKPIFKEAVKFKETAAEAASSVIVAHIRQASNPGALARNKLITVANTQPFTDGTWVFAHNGTLWIHREVAEGLGPLKSRLRGDNDSEVYFWLFLKHYERTNSAPEAFLACVREIRRVWAERRKRHPGRKQPYTSLNALASDGKSLHAFCHDLRRDLGGRSLCHPGQCWSVMSFSRRGDSLLVSSEGVDSGEWTQFHTPEILTATPGPSGVAVTRRFYEESRDGLVPRREEAAVP